LRSALTTRIKEAIFSIFGISQLDSINTNASPSEVSAWKASQKTKDFYKKLFTPINPDDNNSDLYITKIFGKVWPGASPSNLKIAFAITVCQIMLSEHYKKLTMSEDIVKNRLRKNLVSKYILNKFENIRIYSNILRFKY
jgi:hypothetical protein